MNEKGPISVQPRQKPKPSVYPNMGGVVAVIGAGGMDAAIVREVHWFAKELGQPLTIYMIAPLEPWLSALVTPQAEQIRRLADRLGARIIVVTPKEAVSRIGADWHAKKPATVVFGPRKQWPWNIGLSRKTVFNLTDIAKDLNVDMGGEATISTDTGPLLAWRLDRFRPWYHEYVVSFFSVCIAALAVQWLKNSMPAENLSIVFLTAVIFSATAYGFAASLFASIFSVVFFDFFFVSPTFSFSLGSPDKVLLVILFVLVSGITSNLAGRLRDQAEAAQVKEGESRALFQLMRDIATSDTPEDTYEAVARQAGGLFDAETVVLVPHGSKALPIQPADQESEGDPNAKRQTESGTLQPVYPAHSGLSSDDIEAARWSFTNKQECGCGTDKFSVLENFFQPLITANGVVGVLGVKHFDRSLMKQQRFQRLLDSVCRLAAVGVERARQAQELENARVVSQTASLRSALLSSISHDFGTPLASVIGSASSLLSYGDRYTPDVVHDLLSTILEEAERLNKFVNNLLQMTRVESGALVPSLQLTDVDDLVGTVLDNAHRRVEQYELYVDVAERLPLVNIDFVLMETVLLNLLDNACKYSQPETAITIKAYTEGESVVIDVKDEGEGIASKDLGAVFDKFFRVKARDRKVAGTGLGLAICRGILEGQGGTIEALSDGISRGTTMRIRLPVTTTLGEQTQP